MAKYELILFVEDIIFVLFFKKIKGFFYLSMKKYKWKIDFSHRNNSMY